MVVSGHVQIVGSKYSVENISNHLRSTTREHADSQCEATVQENVEVAYCTVQSGKAIKLGIRPWRRQKVRIIGGLGVIIYKS